TTDSRTLTGEQNIMSNWSLTSPPNWNANPASPTTKSDYIATKAGWVDATTGELVVAIPNLAARQGTSLILSIALATPAKTKYKLNDFIDIVVDYSQNVNVVTTGGT